MRNHWLIKSEGACYSIDDLRKDKTTAWTGIRNFQARNYMAEMRVGDLLLFYHSNGTPNEPAGVYGVAKVVGRSHADETALDPRGEHFDSKAVAYMKEGKPPLWTCPDIAFERKLTRPVTLEMLKKEKSLAGMLVLKRGQRLSVMPVEEKDFERVAEMGM